MKGSNFGEFDYFFGINETYFDEDLVSSIIYNNFLSFHISGYNNGKGTIVGNVHNGNDEYPINVTKKKYDNEISTVITANPPYYVSPKLEIEKKKEESILRLDKTKNSCLILEQFTAYKDKPSISTDAFIYGSDTIDLLIGEYQEEFRKADLSVEKLQAYGIYPDKVIQKQMEEPISESYQVFLNELDEAINEINIKYETKRTK